jgi:uncharacterized membrane protein YgdD (TMEM256/DUF423 family)
MDRTFGVIGAVLGFLGVALGAFGAHALRGRLNVEDLEIFEVAVRYQFFHALAILLIALLIDRSPEPAAPLLWAGWAFGVGVLVFSGSLYALTLTGVRSLGAVTPIGGVGLLAGWGLLALYFVRKG